jgi:hypothetical protein
MKEGKKQLMIQAHEEIFKFEYFFTLSGNSNH